MVPLPIQNESLWAPERRNYGGEGDGEGGIARQMKMGLITSPHSH